MKIVNHSYNERKKSIKKIKVLSNDSRFKNFTKRHISNPYAISFNLAIYATTSKKQEKKGKAKKNIR